MPWSFTPFRPPGLGGFVHRKKLGRPPVVSCVCVRYAATGNIDHWFMERQLVVVDVETTGFKPEEGHEIIEIGAQKIIRNRVLAEFHALVKPTRPVDPESMKIHGITDAMLAAKGKTAQEVFPAFVEFSHDLVLVGHNIAFDFGFINAHLLRLGFPILTNHTMDTLAIAKKLLILPSYSLERVAQYLKVPQPAAHRALADVATTHGVLLKLFERAKV